MAVHVYYDLEIKARSPIQEIWLGDDHGHLVQMEIGELRTSLLPGNYVVAFGLRAPTYPIRLRRRRRLTQARIQRGPTCPRPIARLKSVAAAIADAIAPASTDFETAAAQVLEKNQALYRRLST